MITSMSCVTTKPPSILNSQPWYVRLPAESTIYVGALNVRFLISTPPIIPPAFDIIV